jgi:hypothetical protein
MSEDNLTLTSRYLKEMMEKGWTAAAIAKQSDVNQLTVGNIKNGKASRVTDRVFKKIASLKNRIDAGNAQPPRRGPKPGHGVPIRSSGAAADAKRKTAGSGAAPSAKPASPSTARTSGSGYSFESMINTNYVPVDIVRLQGMIDRLIDSFAGAIGELEQIKSQLKI